MDADSEDFDDESYFSPESCLPQVEYAMEAIFDSETAIGMKGNDGFVLAVEKITTEPLLDTTENRKIFTIDQHIGAAVAGLMPDAIRIVNEARTIANNYWNTIRSPVHLNHMMQAIGAYMHENTLHADRRPFASSLIFGSYLPDGPQLYCIEPSGAYEPYNGWAIGRAAYGARSEMEDIDFQNKSISVLVLEAAKIICMVNGDQDDFEFELSWCGEITDGKHVVVPPSILEEAKAYAIEQNSGPLDSNNI